MSKAMEGEVWHSTTALQSTNFRRALGTFATGVTVVATRSDDDEVRAFTANSFTSVSLEPPLVLVCLAKRSASIGVFANADGFSISVLEASQRHLSDAFASRNPETKLAATAHLRGDTVPYVPDSLATFICTPEQVVDAGDHLILIGKVERFVVNEGKPLAFLRGAYVGVEAAPLEIAPVRASVIVGGVLGQNGRVLLMRSQGSNVWSIPTVALHSGIRFENALQQLFSGIGVEISVAAPYSVFKEADEVDTTMIFLVHSETEVEAGVMADGTHWAMVDRSDPALNSVAGVMKAGLLVRYLNEVVSGRWGVYFDSLDGGGVVPMQVEPVSWDAWSGTTGHHRLTATSDKTDVSLS